MLLDFQHKAFCAPCDHLDFYCIVDFRKVSGREFHIYHGAYNLHHGPVILSIIAHYATFHNQKAKEILKVILRPPHHRQCPSIPM